ncbi:hypothetical protein WN51_09463 [Melipona quadrifasciata]|uniref:Uncharacterized protein n=1 Tax=Melipona quadrifasciata TaxID=166423 RepID=A0A0N0BIQ9_9HYME|nr:hypothetical protein WN51_09463 [Melipona quadrifasciata]
MRNEMKKMSQQSKETRSSNSVRRALLMIACGVYVVMCSEMLSAGVFAGSGYLCRYIIVFGIVTISSKRSDPGYKGAIAQYQTTPLLLEVYATPPHESRDPNQPIANFRCISVAPEEARFSGLPPVKSLSVIKRNEVFVTKISKSFTKHELQTRNLSDQERRNHQKLIRSDTIIPSQRLSVEDAVNMDRIVETSFQNHGGVPVCDHAASQVQQVRLSPGYPQCVLPESAASSTNRSARPTYAPPPRPFPSRTSDSYTSFDLLKKGKRKEKRWFDILQNMSDDPTEPENRGQQLPASSVGHLFREANYQLVPLDRDPNGHS